MKFITREDRRAMKRVIKKIRQDEQVELQSAELIAEAHRRALLWCVDNPRFAAHLNEVEALILIGVSIAGEQNTLVPRLKWNAKGR